MQKFLKGDRVYLRPYQTADCISIAVWINDPEVTHFMFYGQLPRTLEQVQSFLEGGSQIANENNVIFVICNNQHKPIGFCGLYDWHRTARKAEMRILLGDKKTWGKGIGTEVVELITWYGFDRLNLHRIYLGFTASNKAAKSAYSASGYKSEGILREDIYRNGTYYDSIRMGILRSEYKGPRWSSHKKRFGVAQPRFLKKNSKK
jgi:RimJ/RimL family protein N-acetyltransferase